MLSFIELTEILAQINAEPSGAEFHGFLCGQICIMGGSEDDIWQEFLDPQSDNDGLLNESYRQLDLLTEEALRKIQSPSLDFQLLLPDDDTLLSERVEALAGWCHGFLNGFGMGPARNESMMSQSCKELLDDFTKICRLESDNEFDQENENALMELIEYVRMGVIIIFEDINANTALYDDQYEQQKLH